MTFSVEHSCQINHFQRPRHTAGFASEPCKPMPLWEVIAFDEMRFSLGLNQQFRWNQITICAPMIRKIHADVPSFQSFVELGKCISVSPSTFPVDKLMGIATISLPNPDFSFFENRKCHISSSSTTTESDCGTGFS